jgi:hypothetical protein
MTAAPPVWPDPAGFRSIDVLRQPPGSLDLDQRACLTELAERVRAVHDLVLVWADRYAVFPVDFAAAQTREVATLGALLRRYGLPDPGAGERHGRFATMSVQSDYDRLLAQGDGGRAAALAAVIEALRQVLAIIDLALPHMRAPDVRQAYVQLYTATLRQLDAVREWWPR